jgi:hypothetical protein
MVPRCFHFVLMPPMSVRAPDTPFLHSCAPEDIGDQLAFLKHAQAAEDVYHLFSRAVRTVVNDNHSISPDLRNPPFPMRSD